MGGSAIGGDLAAAALGSRLSQPLDVVRGYGVPSWTPPDRAIFCSSYSGNTEETIACYAAAEAVGAQRIVATHRRRARRGRAPRRRSRDRHARGPAAARRGRLHVRDRRRGRRARRRRPGDQDGDRQLRRAPRGRRGLAPREGQELAERIDGSVPLLYGCGLTVPIGYRWKCQINENAKLPAFNHQLPEMDHNEIVGWECAEKGAYTAIFLEDDDQHPRERQRFELTAELIGPTPMTSSASRPRVRPAPSACSGP